MSSNQSLRSLHNTSELHYDIWQPQFQGYVENASYQLSGIVSVYIIAIFLFVIIKTTHAHGPRIWLIYHPGNSKFPKRPEIFVIMFSTLPTLLTTLDRAVWKHYNETPLNIGYRWPSCQLVLFCDIFSRTAALYHMIYWTLSQYINPWLLALYLKYLDWTEYDYEEATKKQFTMYCKRRIPCIIYFVSFIVTMPILIMAEKAYSKEREIYVCANIATYDFYHYYDYVCLIILPLVVMVIRFYTSALNKDKTKKMMYRLRCYHVTFVILSIPIFVLNIFFEIFKVAKSTEMHNNKFANGILVSVTAYHTIFIIKPLVYTTGCNCICCGDQCLVRNPRVNRWVVYWSTPQHKEKKSFYAQPIQVTID